jgi:uncharacterized spore protein YtfJ
MTDVFEAIDKTVQMMRDRLSVTTVYGEPVTANGVTVIPVSTMRFGFGGGGGEGGGTGPEGQEGGSGSGGGMGGGGTVEPVGYIEIGDAGTRWVPLEPPIGELLLRGLALIPAFLPGRRGGWLPRLAFLAAGQALVAGFARRRIMGGGGFQRLPFPRRGGGTTF